MFRNKIGCRVTILFYKYFEYYNEGKKANKVHLIEYFEKYQAFCLDLTLDSVLNGVLNFKYK